MDFVRGGEDGRRCSRKADTLKAEPADNALCSIIDLHFGELWALS